jgi:hypothetical protein
MSNFTVLNFVGLFLTLSLSLLVLFLLQKIRQIHLDGKEYRQQIDDYYQLALRDLKRDIIISVLFLMSLLSSEKNLLARRVIAEISDGKTDVFEFSFDSDGVLSANFFNVVNDFYLNVPNCPAKCEIGHAITHLQKTKSPVRLREGTDIRFFLEEINMLIKKLDKTFMGLRAQIQKIKTNG